MWFVLMLLTTSFAAPDGAALYKSRCQSCHGATGVGDGPMARALPGKIPSFSTEAFWKKHTDSSLSALITNGRPGTPMRGFKLKPDQMAALLTHLKTFKPQKPTP